MSEKRELRWVRGTDHKEYMESKLALYEARKKLVEHLAEIIGQAEEDECPTACKIISDVEDALFQLADTITHLRKAFSKQVENGTCQNFAVTLDGFDTATELRAVTGGKCGGLGLDWNEFEGQDFTKCLVKVRNWLVACAEAL